MIFEISDKLIFRISSYATASTDDSVFIIGGFTNYRLGSRTNVIAEYKDGKWKNAGKLAQARSYHGAITFESTTMVLGGWRQEGT